MSLTASVEDVRRPQMDYEVDVKVKSINFADVFDGEIRAREKALVATGIADSIEEVARNFSNGELRRVTKIRGNRVVKKGVRDTKLITVRVFRRKL